MRPTLLIMWTASQSFILRHNKITLRAVISFVCSLWQSRKLKSWPFRHNYNFAVVHWSLTSLFNWSLWKTALSSLFIFTFQFICYLMQIPLKSWTAVTVRVNVWKLLTSRLQTTSSSFPTKPPASKHLVARSAPAWWDRHVSAVLRVCALARKMGKRRFELPPARRLVFWMFFCHSTDGNFWLGMNRNTSLKCYLGARTSPMWNEANHKISKLCGCSTTTGT